MELTQQIDVTYEFSAPRFFDFLSIESEEKIREAELWFEISVSYAPSPFMPKIRKGRSVDRMESEVAETTNHKVEQNFSNKSELEMAVDMEATDKRGSFGFASDAKPCGNKVVYQEEKMSSSEAGPKSDSSFAFPILEAPTAAAAKALDNSNVKGSVKSEALTPKFQRSLVQETTAPTGSKTRMAKKGVKSCGLKPKNLTPAQTIQNVKLHKSTTKCSGAIHIKNATSTDIALENQAIKRQKLEGGCSKKIHDVKASVLLHKSKSASFISSAKGRPEQRKVQEVAPYISTAEMVKKFQSRTREIELPQNGILSQSTINQINQMKPKLTLTRPKEPELETSRRVRAVWIKSSAKLEEEMLAKAPKFKARPLNKKICEAPTLPALPRNTPKLPNFHEFHLKIMERPNQHADTISSVDAASSSQNQHKFMKLTEPRPPILETALRARPTKIKSSQELELEEIEKIPKFKARPLNKKIFESKGDLGLFCQPKSQATAPQEFHFATNDRLGPPPSTTMVDLFDKLSLHSEAFHKHQQHNVRITKPNPFHLHTEERGLEKEKLFELQIFQKNLEEEKARIPKANPYPYTTDYPNMPPKPQPKQVTKSEIFHLDSLIRHEMEMQKMMEERDRMEREAAARRIFKAQPILKEDPIPLPERERRPLTEVQEFVLHVDHRAVERSEFDKKMKEKEVIGKRFREELDHAKMIEEEREIKHMRRAMVPHARPVPKFDNPFHPQKSTKEKTRPESPKLLLNQRERRNHENHALLLR